MKKIELTYDKQIKHDIVKQYREIAIVKDERGKTALVNLETGETISPLGEYKNSFDKAKKWFIRRRKEKITNSEGKEEVKEYITIYDVMNNEVIADDCLITYDRYQTAHGAYLLVIENTKTNEKRFIELAQGRKKMKVPNDWFKNITLLQSKFYSDAYFSVENGKKSALVVYPREMEAKFDYNKIEFNNGIIVLTIGRKKKFRYGTYSPNNTFDSIKFVGFNDNGGVFLAKYDKGVDIYYIDARESVLRQVDTVLDCDKVQVLGFTNISKKGEVERYRLILGVERNKKISINQLEFDHYGWGPVSKRLVREEFDSATCDKHCRNITVQSEGKSGLILNGEEPKYIDSKYDTLTPILNGKYYLGLNNGFYDIIKADTGKAMENNCILDKVQTSKDYIIYHDGNSWTILDEDGISKGYDGFFQIGGKLLAGVSGGNYTLLYGSKRLTKYPYTGFAAQCVSEEAQEYVVNLTNEDKVTYDSYRVIAKGQKPECKRMNSEPLIGSKVFDGGSILEGKNHVYVYMNNIGIIKNFPAGTQTDVTKEKGRIVLTANGRRYIYNGTSKTFNITPEETIKVYTTMYEGEMGRVLVSDIDEGMFAYYCHQIESMPEKDFEEQLTDMYKGIPGLKKKYPGLLDRVNEDK